jgi:hypothetical protein
MKTLKQLITESVNEYLREIEEAGNENAVEEKMENVKKQLLYVKEKSTRKA